MDRYPQLDQPDGSRNTDHPVGAPVEFHENLGLFRISLCQRLVKFETDCSVKTKL
jgi:hypothetical protein